MASELETNIVAVERLDEYSQLAVEDDWDRPSAGVYFHHSFPLSLSLCMYGQVPGSSLGRVTE